MNHFSGVLKVKILNEKIEEAFTKISYTNSMLKPKFSGIFSSLKMGFSTLGNLAETRRLS